MRGARSIAAFAGVLVTILLTAGCGGATAPAAASAAPSAAASAAASAAKPAFDMAALEAKAKAEGAVTFYTTTAPGQNDAVKAAFEKKYPGITVSITRDNNTPLLAKAQAEITSGNILFDIFSIAQRTVYEFNDAAWGDISDLPAWIAFPESTPGAAAGSAKLKTSKIALASLTEKGILINTNKVKPGDLTKWEDVINPKWKGLIGMSDLRGIKSAESATALLDKKYGDAFLQAIAAQKPNIQVGGPPLVALVGSGELAFAFAIPVNLLPQAKQAGAPVDLVFLDPSSGAEQFISMTAKGKHPNAARLMVNWLLTPEGQTVLNGGQQGSSLLPNIPGTLPLSKNYVPTDEKITQAEVDRLAKLIGNP